MEVAEKKGGILIFLPGVGEIRQCIEALRGSTAAGQDIFPLHANLSNEEQRVAFKHTLKWKIIAATNVAEVRRTMICLRAVIHSILSDVYHYRRCHICHRLWQSQRNSVRPRKRPQQAGRGLGDPRSWETAKRPSRAYAARSVLQDVYQETRRAHG